MGDIVYTLKWVLEICLKMESVPNGDEPTSWDELYNINLMPSELFFKFRKELQGIRVGLNMEVLFCSILSLLILFKPIHSLYS